LCVAPTGKRNGSWTMMCRSQCRNKIKRDQHKVSPSALIGCHRCWYRSNSRTHRGKG
jgi:hypothetical protein